jgi:hypothetical protein
VPIGSIDHRLANTASDRLIGFVWSIPLLIPRGIESGLQGVSRCQAGQGAIARSPARQDESYEGFSSGNSGYEPNTHQRGHRR